MPCSIEMGYVLNLLFIFNAYVISHDAAGCLMYEFLKLQCTNVKGKAGRRGGLEMTLLPHKIMILLNIIHDVSVKKGK